MTRHAFTAHALLILVLEGACAEPEKVDNQPVTRDSGADGRDVGVDISGETSGMPAGPDGPADVSAETSGDAPDGGPSEPATCTPACAPFQSCLQGKCSPRYEATVITGATGGTVWDVAVAPDGSIYVVGIFKGTVDFDPGAAEQRQTALAGGDVFVSKYGPGGGYVWTRTIAGTGDEPWVHAIATSDNGVAVSGHYRGMANFFAGQPAAMKTAGAADEGYVLKLGADGGFGFLRTFPGANSSTFDVESLKDGSLVAVGPFAGPVDFGNGPQGDGLSGGYAVRMSPTGSPTWTRLFSGAVVGAAREASDGSLTLAGGYTGKIDSDPGGGVSEVMTATGQSLFAVQLDGAGQFARGASVPFGGAREVNPRDIVHGADGSRYVVGDFIEGAFPAEGSTPPVRPNAGDRDIFVTKLSPTATYAWGRSYGGPASDYAWSATAVTDGVLVTGLFASDSVDFGADGTPDRRESAAGNLFLLHLGAAGAPRGLFTLGPKNAATPLLLRDTQGGFSLAGVFAGAVDFNPHPQDTDQRSSTGRTGFVSRYSF